MAMLSHCFTLKVPGYDGVLQCPDATVVCGESTRGQSTRTSAPMAMTATSSYEPTLPAPSTQSLYILELIVTPKFFSFKVEQYSISHFIIDIQVPMSCM